MRTDARLEHAPVRPKLPQRVVIPRRQGLCDLIGGRRSIAAVEAEATAGLGAAAELADCVGAARNVRQPGAPCLPDLLALVGVGPDAQRVAAVVELQW